MKTRDIIDGLEILLERYKELDRRQAISPGAMELSSGSYLCCGNAAIKISRIEVIQRS